MDNADRSSYLPGNTDIVELLVREAIRAKMPTIRMIAERGGPS